MRSAALPVFEPANASAYGGWDALPTLSWNSARFLALILNALVGLLGFYERESNSLAPDSVYALRILQGHLEEIRLAFKDREFHPAILSTMGNLSASARLITAKAPLPLNDVILDANVRQKIFGEAHLLGLPLHRKVNEHLRWPLKDLLPRDSQHASTAWLDPVRDESYFRCFTLLFDGAGNHSSDLAHCVAQILTEEGRIGFRITRQLFFLAAAKMVNRTDKIGAILKAISPQNSTVGTLDSANVTDHFVDKLCANVRDELAQFRREKKKLARLQTSDSIDLLMEQVFVCLQFGYVDFAEPHVLVAALAWQHPTLGCYTSTKPESIPQFGIAADFGNVAELADNTAGNSNAEMPQSKRENDCRQHTSSAVLVAMAVFLRYILDPGPWPEFQFADQLVQIDQITAEDRFRFFKYVEWVQDSSLHAMPLSPANLGRDLRNRQQIAADYHGAKVVPKPPPMTWSPDLIAFVVLLFVFVVVSVVAHHFLGGKNKDAPRIGGKRAYPYAFKKL